MFERTYLLDITHHSLQPLIKRIEEPSRYIQVLMGPRQVGKTTLVMQLIRKTKTSHHFGSTDAVAAGNPTWETQQWKTARLMMGQGTSTEFLLVIDEIQKINNWTETVKQLWDSDSRVRRDLKVILLGSSRLLLQQRLAESLAERFENTYMGHWSYGEMNG